MLALPGLVWSQVYRYQTRFPFGNPGDIRIASFIANEDFKPGLLLQFTGNGLVQVARDGTRIAGIGVADPDHFDVASLVYSAGDVIPVLRAGAAFAAFQTLAAPFARPGVLARARAYVGAAAGQFTMDTGAGTVDLPKMVFRCRRSPTTWALAAARR